GCVKDEQPAPIPPPPVEYENIVINELITKDLTDPYYVDGLGDGADWLELYNKGTKAINIANMFVTDNPGAEAEYIQIPSTDEAITTIPPKGYLVLICGAADAGGDIPTSIVDGKIFIDMGLSSTGDNFVAIYNPEKVEIDKSDDFNGLEDDISFGRITDAGNEWNTLDTKTPGAPNDGSPPVSGTLIINEFMCSNDTTYIPDGGPDDYPDWIEIYNTGDTPIDIGGWYVTDDMTDPVQYQIPMDISEQTVIPGHGYLILKANGLDEGLHLNFKLGSGGDDIGLSQDGITFDDAISYGTGAGGGVAVPNPGTDYSTGRETDATATWVVFDPNTSIPPSPGTANGTQK
ncbi:MAG: lamin tail domain-containing protein, partial [Bacteroidales bacterium]|nr:lamin tail domain-containing protein [Bacteroidales bacterium]